jgi:hypothetical protein
MDAILVRLVLGDFLELYPFEYVFVYKINGVYVNCMVGDYEEDLPQERVIGVNLSNVDKSSYTFADDRIGDTCIVILDKEKIYEFYGGFF